MKNLPISLLLIPLFFLAAQETTITVTNQNVALVKEVRQLDLQKGRQNISLEDIPSQINASSVLVESDGFEVLEQNYEYDLIGVQKILEKSLGRSILVEHPDQGRVQGTLLSATGTNMIMRNQDGLMQIVPINDEQKITLTDLKGEEAPFVLRPTLVWDVQAGSAGNKKAQISYLTGGIDWRADYVGLLNEDDSKILFSGWVTINNQSGKAFENAKLKLMAGDINLVRGQGRRQPQYEVMAMAKSADQGFEEKAFFEYHLYTLQRPSSVANNQVKQIRLIPETEAVIQKSYRVTSNDPSRVAVVVTLDNSKKNNMGMPLPEGIVRLYKKDGNDREFIGENRIDHTPKDEKIDIEVGSAFDIVSQREVAQITRPGPRTERRSVEFTLRNHKEGAVEVQLKEFFPPYAEIDLHRHDGELMEKKAGFVLIKAKLEADEEKTVKLEYTIRW